jgi:prevent-host-death family protein
MARAVRKSRMKEVPLSEIKDDLSRFLREAEKQEIVITRHGKPAGILIGFETEEDWFHYKLEMTRGFLSVSNGPGRVSGLAGEPGWKTYLSSGAASELRAPVLGGASKLVEDPAIAKDVDAIHHV